ncbi:hypothetical protein MWU60_18325 [Yoonia sp. F2084L]|uniref:hypothetical protein n=1 Tax=Yoonia sp. F2084L TaxID=2926419 RepID=UPI001FF47842|nr:hypothetical protein [Yoonia sp. F2084L]MCK0097539.1 hypothetical protein [Yoonia sp. F2084L]
MNKSFAALGLTFILAGCGISYPQTGAELQSMASTSPLVSSESYAVSRSASAVTNSLRSLSSKCLNRTTESIMAPRQTQFGVQGTQFVTRWETTVRSSGNGAELAMRMVPIRGSVNEPSEGYIFFAASVQSNGSGAQVTHYQGSIGAGAFSDQVKAWANGSSRTCPDMPR